MIREIVNEDYEGLMKLYMQLHDNPFPEKDSKMEALWNRILEDKDHHIIVAVEDGKIAASCVCVIIPNLTHGQRPYALIENVITDEAFRKRGLATACLNYAREIAVRENCYKMMLLTGSKEVSEKGVAYEKLKSSVITDFTGKNFGAKQAERLYIL